MGVCVRGACGVKAVTNSVVNVLENATEKQPANLKDVKMDMEVTYTATGVS